MKKYILNDILHKNTDSKVSDYVLLENSEEFYEDYIYFCKPDFTVLLDVKNQGSVIYYKNYSLNFDPSQEGTFEDIIEGTDSEQVVKIMKADKHCLDFARENKLFGKSIVFELRFSGTLIKGKPQTFLRKISFVKSKNGTSNDPVLLVSFFNVTELVGRKKDPFLDIKYFDKTSNEQNISDKISIFKEKMNDMLHDDLKLTKREKEILELISKGQTSDEIAVKLFISIATVNTHRQNLIKKFNVKNTASLIHMV